MGHLDDEDRKHTVTLFLKDGSRDVFNHCTEVEENDESIEFVDLNGLRHRAHGLAYKIAEE